jgi:cytoplasmic iron level regulating protein YaaA (DUF328/UPF0246 family)
VLILLPPSETKRDGGDGSPVQLDSLAFDSLRGVRRSTLSKLRRLSRSRNASVLALKLGPQQHGEVDRNRAVMTSPTMAALDRYTGVLFDALDPSSLTPAQRGFAHGHLVIHSALFGLVAAGDEIPAYRLSADSRIPGFSLKTAWSAAVSAAIAESEGLVLDLRSEGYAGLGPAPQREDSLYVRVVTRDERGSTRALNHFNKQAKGLFARALIEANIDHAHTGSLLRWGRDEGFELSADAGQLELVVPQVTGLPGNLMASLRQIAE